MLHDSAEKQPDSDAIPLYSTARPKPKTRGRLTWKEKGLRHLVRHRLERRWSNSKSASMEESGSSPGTWFLSWYRGYQHKSRLATSMTAKPVSGLTVLLNCEFTKLTFALRHGTAEVQDMKPERDRAVA